MTDEGHEDYDGATLAEIAGGALQSPWTWGLFDETFWPCLVPQTRVLREDLSWVPIGELHVGDGVVGVDEQPFQPGVSRSYRRATVEAVRALRAPAMRIIFDDDREVVCTPNHRWLVKFAVRSERPWHWRTAGTLQPGYRICKPLDPWTSRDSYDGGWFAGLLDGEGCLRTKRGRNMSGVSFSQKPGAVLDHALGLLAQWGVPFTMHSRKDNGVVNVDICQKAAAMALLGSVRPVRLLVPRAWEHMRVRSNRQYAATITSVEPVGDRDVVDLCTSTGTYIAEGLVSHNSYFEDNDFHYRCANAGIACLRDLGALFRHDVSHTLRCTDMGQRIERDGLFQRNAERFRQKWGGLPHQVQTAGGGHIQSARPANVTSDQQHLLRCGSPVHLRMRLLVARAAYRTHAEAAAAVGLGVDGFRWRLWRMKQR